MSRTIDNLGIESSIRYAEDQKNFNEQKIKDAQTVPLQAQVDVSIPSFSSEWAVLFEISKCNIVWAVFYAPPKYTEQKKRLFTNHIIPSLGSEDKQETQVQRILTKIRARVTREKEEKEQNTKEKEQHKREQTKQEKKMQEEEKESKVLTFLLEKIGSLDKALIDINSRRSQYQKG